VKRVVLEPILRSLTYALMALTATTVAALLGRDPFTTTSALGLTGSLAAATSLAMGLVLACATIAASRVLLRTSAWARALHAELRPALRHTSELGIIAVALASGIVEELVFRGLLVPMAGLVLSSAAFGLLHQVRGRGRWAWATWAAFTGLALGAIFVLTGSLAGPILAHASINLVNMRHLRDTDVGEPRARLGGMAMRERALNRRA
jgi:uncharacterized protein